MISTSHGLIAAANTIAARTEARPNSTAFTVSITVSVNEVAA